MSNAAKPIQDITVEKPNIDFQKEHDLRELTRVLNDHADGVFVSYLLTRLRRRLLPQL